MENPFIDISALYRPAPFWSWNDKLNKEELCRQIDQIADKGWGGYFMHSRVGLITGYLSDGWFELVNICAEKAEETGTYAWLYDEDRWPSGYAGGIVAQNPEYRSRALMLVEREHIIADDHVFDEIDVDGRAYCIIKRVSPVGHPVFNGMSYVDLMNPKAVQEFLRCTHQEYKKHCGQHFGKSIPGIFTDEPCYLMHNHYDVPVMPWSDYLPEYFEKKKGYDITNHIKELFYDINDYQKIRYDFFDCATTLFLESFTIPYYDWCTANKLIMIGHFMAEDSLTAQTRWIGAAMPHYEFMHWPGIDKLGRQVDQNMLVKQLTSVAEQLGKERAVSEVFGCIGQQCAFRERKWIADWQAVLGINFVNHHLSLYTMKGERKRDYPANFFYQQPWWEEERMSADYIGRICQIAAFGKREANVLIIHPQGSAWSVYSPVSEDQTIYDEPFNTLTNLLVEDNIDFHYGDEGILAKHASVISGGLKIGEYEYHTIVVPPSLTLRGSTIKLLNEFEGNVIYVSPFPQRIDGRIAMDAIVKKAVKAKDVTHAAEILAGILPQRVRTIDRVSGENAKQLITVIRETEDEKILFVVNSEENSEIDAQIQVYEKRIPLVVDLTNGNLHEIPYECVGDMLIIKAKIYPCGSLAILFTNKKYNTCKAKYLHTGVMFDESFTASHRAEGYTTEMCGMNVISLNNMSFYANGQMLTENAPVFKALREYFYKLEDGTPFSAEYRFSIMQMPVGEVYAAIECPNNLEEINVNGIKVDPPPVNDVFNDDIHYKDVNIVKIPISQCLKQGENVIKLSGKKINNIIGVGVHRPIKKYKNYNTTEPEAIYIVGDFHVENLNNTEFHINGARSPANFHCLTDGNPFYSGKAVISCTVDINEPEKAHIRINGVQAAYCKLYVNGSEVGCTYLEPYIFKAADYCVKGKNQIRIEVANTLFNTMGPNWIEGILDTGFVGPTTFTDCSRYTEKYAFVPFGIDSVDVLY